MLIGLKYLKLGFFHNRRKRWPLKSLVVKQQLQQWGFGTRPCPTSLSWPLAHLPLRSCCLSLRYRSHFNILRSFMYSFLNYVVYTLSQNMASEMEIILSEYLATLSFFLIGVWPQLSCRGAWPWNNCGQCSVQHVCDNRSVCMGHPWWRSSQDQTPKSVLYHCLLEYICLYLALPHTGRYLTGDCGGVFLTDLI